MGRWIRVRAIKKEEPNIGLYVQALIALARQLQTEEDQRGPSGADVPSSAEAGQEVSHEGN
jgi:hypothetical protein